MNQTMMALQEIHYRYPNGAAALNGVTLAVHKGKKLAILGANGSGKSTLLLHMVGLLHPQQGVIYLEGERVRTGGAFRAEWRRRVGLVFQNPEEQLFAPTVAQDVAFGPLNLGLTHEESRAIVAESLIDMGIAHLADRPPHALSFGEKKRVAIAGVVAMRPQLMLLDEPTAGLDPAGAGALLRTLAQRHGAGTTLLFSTHDVDLAFGWADEVAILKGGKLLARGSSAQILMDRQRLQEADLPLPTPFATLLQLHRMGWLREGGSPEAIMAQLMRKEV